MKVRARRQWSTTCRVGVAQASVSGGAVVGSERGLTWECGPKEISSGRSSESVYAFAVGLCAGLQPGSARDESGGKDDHHHDEDLKLGSISAQPYAGCPHHPLQRRDVCGDESRARRGPGPAAATGHPGLAGAPGTGRRGPQRVVTARCGHVSSLLGGSGQTPQRGQRLCQAEWSSLHCFSARARSTSASRHSMRVPSSM